MDFLLRGRNFDMEKQNVKAVLFDLDGTLVKINWDISEVDAEVLKFAAKRNAHLECGSVVERISELRGKLSREREKKEYMRMLFDLEERTISERGASVCDGAKEILRAVKLRRVKTALVSNNFREHAKLLLENYGMLAYFDQLVCWDDVERPKPDAEPIVEALRRLKVSPSEAFFVGDGRLTDLVAAKAADVECLIVESGKISDFKAKILDRL